MISGAMEYRPIFTAPTLPIVAKGVKWIENFTREALNPTNAVAVYTESENGAGGTSAMLAEGGYGMTTDTTIGNDVTLRTSLINFKRASESPASFINSLSKLELNIEFELVEATDTEGFVGLLDTTVGLSALPTTDRHIGIYWDLSAGANFMLTSANGTTQVTTDTGIAIATTRLVLKVIWDGQNTGSAALYAAATGAQQGATHNVTALGMTTNLLAMELVWFIQTEGAAAKTLRTREWSVEGS